MVGHKFFNATDKDFLNIFRTKIVLIAQLLQRFNRRMGINVASREILSRIPPEHKYGLDDLLLDLLQRGERIHVEPYGGYWLDIGRPDDYTQASEQFEQNKNLFLQ